jgi:hypothetical protein
MIDKGPLKNFSPAAKRSFLDAMRGFGRLKGYYGLGKSVFDALKDVGGFILNPVRWLSKYVKGVGLELLEVYLKAKIADYIGAKRFGCHSLIAKDSGPAVFNEAAMECAKAVHWYVVHALTRHSRERVLAVARGGDAHENRNKISAWEWIDWLELLEYFLAHPLAETGDKGSTRFLSATTWHLTRGPSERMKSNSQSIQRHMSRDSLESLAREYAPTFQAVEGGPQELTWEVIADANYPTIGMSRADRRRQVNRVLRHNGGVLAHDGINYAYPPNHLVTIPYQRVPVTVTSGATLTRRWWHDVIVKKNHDNVMAWFENGEPSARAPRDAHRWYPISRDDAFEVARDGRSHLTAREKAY